MHDTKHIDKLFSDKLGRHMHKAPEGVWLALSDSLRQQRKKRVAFILQRVAAVFIALLTLSGTIGYYYLSRTDSHISQTLITDNQTNKLDRSNNTQGVENELFRSSVGVQHLKPADSSRNVLNPVKESDARHPSDVMALSSDMADVSIPVGMTSDAKASRTSESSGDKLTVTPMASISGKVAELPITHADQALPSPTPEEIEQVNQRIFDAIAQLQPVKKSSNDFYVGGQIGPQYSGSSVAEITQNSETVEQGLFAYAGGVNISFSATRRLLVQSGVFYNRMGSSANYYYSTYANNKNIRIENTANNFGGYLGSVNDRANSVNEGYYGDAIMAPADNVANTTNQPDAIQFKLQTDYIEVPLYLRYRVIDRKIDLHLLGGLSANFRVGESLTQGGGETLLNAPGYQPDNRVKYNSTMGIGVLYPVYDRLQLSLEPVFRYYLKSESSLTSDRANPYSMGIMAGVMYVF